MSIFSAIGGLLGIGDQNPADAASEYYNKLPGLFNKTYQPYMQQGQNAYGLMQPQMQQMLQNPGQLLSNIGKGFQQSPGYQFQMNQAMDAARAMGGAQGMAGSPANQQQAMTVAHGLADQDYNNYLGHALGLFGQGMNTAQDMYHTGYGAANAYANNLGNAYMNQGNLAYSGQASQNQSDSNLLGGIGHALSSIF